MSYGKFAVEWKYDDRRGPTSHPAINIETIYPVVGRSGVQEAHVLRVLMTYIRMCDALNFPSNGNTTMTVRVEILYCAGDVSPSVKNYKFYTFPGNSLMNSRVLSFTCVRGCDVIIVLRASACDCVIIIVMRLQVTAPTLMKYNISKENASVAVGRGEGNTHAG